MARGLTTCSFILAMLVVRSMDIVGHVYVLFTGDHNHDTCLPMAMLEIFAAPSSKIKKSVRSL